MATLAFDLGGTKLAAALVAADGRLLRRAVSHTRPQAGASGWVDDMARFAERWRSDFDRVGVAVTGAVRDGRWHALNRRILDVGTDDYPLLDALAGRVGRAVHVANDAQAAAWGEYVRGAGRGTRDMVFLTVSTGIGGGIVLGGHLHRGAHALAGHVGQIPHGEPEAPLEDAAGGRALGYAYADGVSEAAPDAQAAFRAASDGDGRAEAIVERSATRVAWLCRTLQATLDPELIVLGGGIGLAPGYLERVRHALAPHAGPLHPTLARADLGADAGLVGIADLARSVTPRSTARPTGRTT